MRLDVAEVLAEGIQALLKDNLPNAQIASAGEYRRKCETIGSLDFVVTDTTLEPLQNVLANIEGNLSRQGNELRLELDSRLINLSVVSKDVFGAVLAYKTGNSDYLTRLEEAAQTKGWSFSAQGLFREGQVIVTPSEQAFYDVLGVPWLIPELREEKTPLVPNTILELSDIKGQVHNHSTWSDAVHSIREMVQACIDAGFNYLAMADHSKTSYYANGLSEERVLAQAKEIAEIRQELEDTGSDFKLLHGIEVDIMSDGSLDYDDEILDLLDYAVVSVHQNFTLSQEAQTERIIKAIQHPKASILAHPTGRLLLRRPEYAINLDAVIDACAQTRTVIEINASPYRLDLDWRWVKKAKAKGCSFSVNPDAHHIDQFAVLKYGVMMARKAGLSKEDVVNTAVTAEGFLARLKGG
jgi:DNA polymerase (family 10)